MILDNLVLIFFIIGFTLFFYKYFLLILNKYNSKLLIDDQFNKPQAFHSKPISIAGGLGIFLPFLALITGVNILLRNPGVLYKLGQRL